MAQKMDMPLGNRRELDARLTPKVRSKVRHLRTPERKVISAVAADDHEISGLGGCAA